jgi:hypothetical protein
VKTSDLESWIRDKRDSKNSSHRVRDKAIRKVCNNKCLCISRHCLLSTTQRVGNFDATHAMKVILVYLAKYFFPDVSQFSNY